MGSEKSRWWTQAWDQKWPIMWLRPPMCLFDATSLDTSDHSAFADTTAPPHVQLGSFPWAFHDSVQRSFGLSSPFPSSLLLDQAEWILMFLIQSPLPLARQASEVSKQLARIWKLMPLFAAGACKWLCTHQHARRGFWVWLDNAPSWHHVPPAIIFNSSASFYHNRRK